MPALVIVGASLAGARAAQAARSEGWDGEIILIGDEPNRPYARPPLSKEILTTPEQGVSDHLLPMEEDAQWLLGERAVELDRQARRVSLASGEQVPYARLVIATGCRARRWEGAGAELEGVHTIRRVEDALALRAALAGRPRLAVIGAGFVGCEVAASARALGLDVTLIDVAPTPMPVLGPLLGARYAAQHVERGVALRLGAGIRALHGSDRVEAVELADGTRVGADVVVVSLGALPCTDWLSGSGLELQPGVVCDRTLTSVADPDVLAAGDVAAWPHSLSPGARIRVEHWTNAAEQGSLAGRNVVRLASARQAHSGMPSFWSDQYGLRIQAVGLPGLAQQVHLIEESEDGTRFVAVAERDRRVVAVIAMGAPRRVAVHRRRVGTELRLDALRGEIAADAAALGSPLAGSSTS